MSLLSAQRWQSITRGKKYWKTIRLLSSVSEKEKISKGCKADSIVLLTNQFTGRIKKGDERTGSFIRCQKVMLLFDESDTISNGNSKRTKAMLSVFRKCRYKVLNRTMTETMW